MGTEDYLKSRIVNYVCAVLNVNIAVNEILFREINEAGVMTDVKETTEKNKRP